MDANLREVMLSERNTIQEKAFLSFDILCEVLNWADAETLARAACVSSEFRRVCKSEEFWERCCNSRWPSTKEPAVKALISQSGGFRKFYAQCHSSLSGEPPEEPYPLPTPVEDHEPNPSDFVSIVDIIYDGKPMLSRMVTSFPGAEDPSPGWFDCCPFQFDLLDPPDESNSILKDDDGNTTVAVHTDLNATAHAEDRKLGHLWNALNSHMIASWILINKKTGRMANLASSKPVGGLRHWPCEDDFVLHFGTIIPSTQSAIHCSVGVKARYCTTETGCVSGGSRTSIALTEVGMKLENVDGCRLYGMESVTFLDKALSCSSRTAVHATLLHAFQSFRTRQAARKAERTRQENRRELVAALVSSVGAFLCLCYILL